MSKIADRPTLPVTRTASVDEVFQRLALRYGKHWLDMWVGLPLAEVKREWAAEIAKFHRIQVEQAIAQCGKFPPTLPEFAALCAQMPRPFVAAAERPGPALIEDKTKNEMPDAVREKLRAFVSRHKV